MATKIFREPALATAPTDHHTSHPEFKGVQFAPQGLVVNVPKPFQRESMRRFHMYSKTAFMSAWPVLGATVIACTLFAGSVAAEGQEFTVAYRVTTQGLDVNQPAGARAFYLRLRHAAEVVCTHGMRMDLKPVADKGACYEKALAKSIGSANLPLVTQVYLQTHTLRDAAALGIELPVQVAAK
jgi:UrcA family protein